VANESGVQTDAPVLALDLLLPAQLQAAAPFLSVSKEPAPFRAPPPLPAPAASAAVLRI
jgi:hypothetical protein